MHALAGIFAVLVGIAGWFYLFQARGGAGLECIEGQRRNRWRSRLRRVGGLAMLMLAGLFYIAFRLTPTTPDQPVHRWLALAWLGVIALLGIVIALGLIDVLLTHRLRRDLRKGYPA